MDITWLVVIIAVVLHEVWVYRQNKKHIRQMARAEAQRKWDAIPDKWRTGLFPNGSVIYTDKPVPGRSFFKNGSAFEYITEPTEQSIETLPIFKDLP
jgi:hypothetical protein